MPSYRTVVAISAMSMALSACVGMPGSAQRECYNSGLKPHTAEFKACWKPLVARQAAEENARQAQLWGQVLGVAAAIGTASATAPQPAPVYLVPAQPRAPQAPLAPPPAPITLPPAQTRETVTCQPRVLRDAMGNVVYDCS